MIGGRGPALRLQASLERLVQAAVRLYQVGREEGVGGVGQRLQHKLWQRHGGKNAYRRWVELYDTLADADRQQILVRIDALSSRPLVSVVMPVYNVGETWLRAAIDSVRRQIYPHWELCIADDDSTLPHVRAVLEDAARADSRIKVVFRERNGHISAASNSALALATGEFVAFLDHDDEMSEHALYMVAEELTAHPQADLVYSDEDKISDRGKRYFPNFKPDWNQDLFYSLNLITHLAVYRTAIVREVGGFRIGYEGSQDYDLALRVIERVSPANIRHIPHVLYHWRAIPGSVALAPGEKQYAHEAARRAIRSHFERTGVLADVVGSPGNESLHRARYPLRLPRPMVSLVVNVGGHSDGPERTVGRVVERTEYQPVEVLPTGAYASAPLSSADSAVPLNPTAALNRAVRQGRGEVIVLLGSVEPLRGDWLDEMVSHVQRAEIGAVGARVYRPDEKIEHAGVVLGIHGLAGYAFRRLPNPRWIARASVLQNYSAVAGGCLAVRREAFEEVGGFDEINLPTAFADIDLCLRLGERGYRVLWTPYAELRCLTVRPGARVAALDARQVREQQDYMRSRWRDVIHHDPHYNPNLTLERDDFSLAMPPRRPKPWRTR